MRQVFISKCLAVLLLGAVLLWPGPLAAFEEDTTGIDTIQTVDSLRKAMQINITPGEIEIRFDDGADTMITRTGGPRETSTSRKHEIIAFGENKRIEAADSIRGDVFLILGDLDIDGYVRGDITVLAGDLRIGLSGDVEGKIYCLGTVTLDSGAHIWGDIKAGNLVTPMMDEYYDFRGEFSEKKIGFSWKDIFWSLTSPMMIVYLLLVILSIASFILILPRPVARIRYQIETGFMKCFLVGVLLTIALFPLWLMIVITIIGIPVAILIFPFVVIGAYVLGAIGFTQFAGFELSRRTTLRYEGYLKTTLAGNVLIGSPLILAVFFQFINIDPLTVPIFMIFLAVQFIMFTAGIGAVFFSRFGTRPQEVKLYPDSDTPKPEQPVPELTSD
jgi:hypothetical protein